MIILLAFFAAQAVETTATDTGLESALAASKLVANQTFECMDSQTKIQLSAHISDATPENVVNGAMASCQYLKKSYVEAVTSPDSYISQPAAQTLANNWFKELRSAYLQHVDEWLIKPELADTRENVVLMQWRKCITNKAADWSRLRDDAATVGQATITACHDYRQNVITATVYVLRSKNLPTLNAEKMVDSFQSTMKDVAIETIISERAKRLPKKP